MNEQLKHDTRALRTEGFKSVFKGKLDAKRFDHGLATVSGTGETAYPATGSVASLLLWTKCRCACEGRNFEGSAWGITFPGGGALFGHVYTSDLQALFSRTDNFALYATPVYTSFWFFDSDSHYLGSFQAGSVSTTSGEGGGKGHW